MLGGDGSIVETGKDVKEFLFGSLDVPLVNLETSLQKYVGVLPILVYYMKFFYFYYLCFLLGTGSF